MKTSMRCWQCKQYLNFVEKTNKNECFAKCCGIVTTVWISHNPKTEFIPTGKVVNNTVTLTPGTWNVEVSDGQTTFTKES